MSIKPIHDVENMPPEAIELFEAAGYIDAQKIFDQKISDITIELVKANNVLEIIGTTPTREMVLQWLQPLEAKYGIAPEDDSLTVHPGMLIEPEDFINIPHSLPISEQYLKNNNINLVDLPSGKLRFTDKEQAREFIANYKTATLSYDVLTDPSLAPASELKQAEPTVLFDKPKSFRKESQILDMSRVLKMETYQNEGSRISPIPHREDIHNIKSARIETNKGINPQSKFFVKGVLHKDAPTFKSGCRWFIVVNLLVFLSFALTTLVLYDKERFSWAVWSPLLAVLSIFIYFGVTQRSKCPVCNQKQFAPKICRKHKDAHQWPVIGYMLPTSIHALVFKWFRCIYCGTSVRLKK
jgi:hypothetical protein